MSSKKKDDDLTRVLDGWVPGAGKGDPPIDPTRVLDGWKPGGGRDTAPRDLKLPLVEQSAA